MNVETGEYILVEVGPDGAVLREWTLKNASWLRRVVQGLLLTGGRFVFPDMN